MRREDQGQELHDRRRGGGSGPDGLSRFDELRRRTAAHTAILYVFDLIEHDGEGLRNLRFLDRKAALARLLHDTKAGILLNERAVGMVLSFSPMLAALVPRASSPSGRRHLSVRSLPGLDQGPQSSQRERSKN